MLKPSGGIEPVDVLPRQRSRSVVVAARPAYEPPITSTLVGGCSPPPILNRFLVLRKGAVEWDLGKERGDEALRLGTAKVAVDGWGSTFRRGNLGHAGVLFTGWGEEQAPNSRHGKHYLTRHHDRMIKNCGVCPQHRYREALDLQHCSAFAKCTCTALQPCRGT